MPNDNWALMYRTGALAAFAVVFMIVLQMIFYVIWPPVLEIEAIFVLFNGNWFRALQSLDLFLITDTFLSLVVILAVGVALWETGKSLVVVALACAVAGSAAYFSANTAFEMFDLAVQYGAATDPGIQSQLLAAGRFALANFQGTGFAVFYVLSGLQTLLLSGAVLRNGRMPRHVGWVGVVAGLTMLVPPIPATGQVGLVMSLVSLPPLAVWLVLVGLQLWRLAQQAREQTSPAGRSSAA